MSLQFTGKEYLGVAPKAFASSATTTGTVIDVTDTGATHAKVTVFLGARTDGTLTPDIYESDDNSTFTAVAADWLEGTEAAAAVSTANTIKSVGVILTKPYLRVDGVASGVTSGFTGGINVELTGIRHSVSA